MVRQVRTKDFVFSSAIQGLCAKSYPGHPHGCPNYGCKSGCPPNQPLINRVLDFSRPIYVIWVDLDLQKWARLMARRHPKLKTQAQRTNLRYWQPVVRAKLKKEIERATQGGLIEIAVDPEAQGVNVSRLLQAVGVQIEWPVKRIVRKVILGGFPHQ